MTSEEMSMVGAIHSQARTYLSDDELKSQIEALDLVIAYLQGRNDCSLVVFPLKLNRETYQGFVEARKKREGPVYLVPDHKWRHKDT